MDILIVILIPILGVLVYEALSNAYNNLHKKETIVDALPCPPHVWALNHLEQMICNTCNRRPGE